MRPNSYLPKALKGATILLHIGLLLVTGFASLVSELRLYACDNSTTYAEGSRYSSNLNTVMDYLLHNISQTRFNSTSYGQDPNKVYGLLQCVGNISAEDCSSCSQKARTRIETYCGNGIGGQVWMDYCFLRYNNSNFISVLDTQEYYLYNSPEFQGNHEAFSSTAFNLLSNLAKKAYNPTSKGFASASISYNSSVRVYGLVQCWKDISVEDCRNCLTLAMSSVQNCCSKRQGAQVLFGSCTLRYEIYPFFNFSGYPSAEGSIPPTVAGSPSPIGGSAHGSTPLSVAEILAVSRISEAIPSKKASKNLALILGVGGGVIPLLVLCLFRLGKKIKSAIFRRPVTLVRQNEGTQDDVESVLLEQQQKFNFRLETLLEATEGFHGNNKLGEGGFGVVYKGTMRDGKLIAVKKLSVRSGQGKKEFTNEVKLVANVQHRNLVKLLGCCVEGVERLLVYEYLANKSLDTFLFDPEKRNILDWRKRYNIIAGIARGLLYLHEDSPLRIIHRDIKASNILLDDKLNPKIADFGLARLFPEDKTHIQTRIAGTFGYMAPEYAMRGQLSVKVDVYSFGVVLLEIVSGRRNSDDNFPEESQSFLQWVWRLYRRGHVFDMVDPVLTENSSQKQLLRCVQVGLLCTQADAALRPFMSNIIVMISSNSVTLPEPTIPAFVNISRTSASTSTSWGFQESSKSATTSTSTSTVPSHTHRPRPSINETSTTDLDPR